MKSQVLHIVWCNDTHTLELCGRDQFDPEEKYEKDWSASRLAMLSAGQSKLLYKLSSTNKKILCNSV